MKSFIQSTRSEMMFIDNTSRNKEPEIYNGRKEEIPSSGVWAGLPLSFLPDSADRPGVTPSASPRFSRLLLTLLGEESLQARAIVLGGDGRFTGGLGSSPQRHDWRGLSASWVDDAFCRCIPTLNSPITVTAVNFNRMQTNYPLSYRMANSLPPPLNDSNRPISVKQVDYV